MSISPKASQFGPGPQTTEDFLIEPWNSLFVQYCRAGGELESHPRIQRLRSWFQTGEIEKLARILEKDPEAIRDDLVIRQVMHLYELAHELPMKVDLTNPPPPDSPKVALRALKTIAAAWVRGLLPGWTVDIRRTRGQPRKTPQREAQLILLEFNQLLEKLNAYDPTLFTPQPDQRREDLVGEAVKILRDVYRGKPVVEQVPGQPEFLKGFALDREQAAKLGLPDEPVEVIGDTPIFVNPDVVRVKLVPIADEVLRDIAQQALERTRISKNRLLYGLLAHRTGMTIGQIRGIIERAEADYPNLTLRRHPRQ